MHAAATFERGKWRPDVEAGWVSAQSASRWHRAWLETDRDGLAGAGRRRGLSGDHLAQVEAELAKGPKADGFVTEMWTLARVSEVIEQVTGVRHLRAKAWAVLRELLGWTRQRPARRAVERNDGAIATWVKTDWPRKEALGAAAPG
jgi:transposase